jgi:hypothetical protein
MVTLAVLARLGAAVGVNEASDVPATLGAAVAFALPADGPVAAPHVTANTLRSDRIAERRTRPRIGSRSCSRSASSSYLRSAEFS